MIDPTTSQTTPPAATAIRVALVDDHPVVLAGIRSLLDSEADISVVGTATTAADGLALIESQRPDLAVVDISLPDMSGISLAQRIANTHPETRLITLTVHESRAYVQSLILAGVKGYVLKRAAAEDLVRAVRAVAAGGMYLDPSVAEQALPSASAHHPAGADDLSPREEAVLRFTAQGFSNKEIAVRLEISIKSVETYKARAASKRELRSRADIVRFGVSQGWLDPVNIP